MKKEIYYIMAEKLEKMLSNKLLLPVGHGEDMYINENLRYKLYCSENRTYFTINIYITKNNNLKKTYTMIISKYWNNSDLNIDIEVDNKKISFFDKNADYIIKKCSEYLEIIYNEVFSFNDQLEAENRRKILEKINKNKEEIKKIENENNELRELLTK